MKTIEYLYHKYFDGMYSDDITEEIIIKFAEDYSSQAIKEKLRWIPIDKLDNPTIPFLGKDKFGKIELFKVADIYYLKAMDIVECRSIL